MKLLVSGSSGLVGSALCRAAGQRGHDVVRLVRGERDAVRSHDDRVWWDPNHEQIDMPSLSGIDGVVHLAGESIAEGRWTEAKKRRIKESRVRSTHLLSRTVATMAEPPRVLISASAVGYYGDRGDEELDETSPPGSGFLADLCQQWEAATQVAADAGVRTVMTVLV